MEQGTILQPYSQMTGLSDSKSSNFYFYCKRFVDLSLGILSLIFLAPLLLLIAIFIKLDTSGPVLFAQERVGARRRHDGERTVWEIQTFRCYKFRSMFHDADQSLHHAYIKAFVEGQVEPSDGATTKFKLTGDPRVTRVGSVLRRASLDELPQLLNVLKGEMSLVGPRPVPAYEVAGYQGHHFERLTALPGITGLWQVKGRGQVPFEEMIRLDIKYARSQSLLLDIKILFLTIPAVLSGRGAE